MLYFARHGISESYFNKEVFPVQTAPRSSDPSRRKELLRMILLYVGILLCFIWMLANGMGFRSSIPLVAAMSPALRRGRDHSLKLNDK